MKKSHRRTQSANIIYDNSEQITMIQDRTQFFNDKNLVMKLLNQCSNYLKQKVCHVQTLHVKNPDEDNNKMFNFGKGLMKQSIQKQQKVGNGPQLISIPETYKTENTKRRKPSEIDLITRSKSKNQNRIIMKNTNKQFNKQILPYNDSINKLIKSKIGKNQQINSKYEKLLGLNLQNRKKNLKQSKHERKKSQIK